MPAPAAALCNAYQPHCSEFDCVHEKAVVHAMTAVLAAAMDINYARLCARFVAARMLLAGSLGFHDFTADTYRDPATAALAAHIVIEVRDAGDPNALTPVEVEITTHDGSRHRTALTTVLGNPLKPLSPEAHLAKLRGNAAAALRPLAPMAVERLIAMVDRLETLPDVTELADVLG